MIFRAGVAFGLALGLLFPGPPARAQELERLFYYRDSETSYHSLIKHIDQITVLGPQVYTVDSLGIVFGSIDRRVMELARRHGVKVMPLVVNEGFHQPSLRRLLADSAAQRRAVRTLVELCRDNGFWGIQFDIENINLQDRDRFTTWYSEAARALHGAGCTISIAVVHRPEESPGPSGYHRFLYESWRAGYDLKALGAVGDFISIMSYSQHTRRTPPGPQAGLPWMRAVVDYFLRFVPPEKLSLGIPLWGEHWFTRDDPALPERARSWSGTVSWSWGTGLAERHSAPLQWDSIQGVTWGYYDSGGTFEWLFLEDVRSFQAKLALVKARKLRGFSAWVLGPEDERIWEVLR
ncbi:MAG: glycosyl hydrolase [Gemmatimonadetes bacterium]|nr:glycosyl hydrolase [Gemmatimonadota bacterium]